MHTYSLDGQKKTDLNDCLSQLADILKAVGVEELTIEDDFQYYRLDNQPAVGQQFIDSFCLAIQQMHERLQQAGR